MSALPPTVNPRVLREKLRAHFGFRQFRPGQLEAVKCAMQGRDVLVVMPAGRGDPRDHLVECLVAAGGEYHLGPLLRRHLGRRQPDPARRAVMTMT